MPNYKKIFDMTWEELNDYLKVNSSIIIPIGTCEQHSKHLPLNTDTIVAEYMAEIISQELGVLIAPTINYGVNLPCDRFYTGTCSLKKETLTENIIQIIDWWKLQGFKKFFILTAHGDPFHIKALKAVNIKNTYTYILEIYEVDMEDILEKQSCVKHACEVETSVMLYLFPQKVKLSKLEDFQTPFEVFIDYLEHKNINPITNSPGCQGYPTYASKEKGKLIFNRMKEKSLKFVANNL